MEKVNPLATGQTVHLIHEETRYHGGYESPSSISRIQRLEIILFPDGSFTLTHGRHENNRLNPRKKSGWWELDCSESAFCKMNFNFFDGSLQKMSFGKSDNMFVFLDNRRFRVEILKPQELGLTK